MTSRKIAHILKTDEPFIVVTHISPDGDAIGSLLGMSLALNEMGRRCAPFIADDIPALYSFLPGRDSVVASPDKLPFAPKWIISVDCAEEKRISGDITSVRESASLINIDHHPTNPQYGDINLIDPNATSTAEIVLQVLKATDYSLSADVAKCLYTGVITDTGGFRFAGVGASTFQTAAELVSAGFDPYEICQRLFEEYPIGRLYLERLMLERMEALLEGKLIMSTLYESDFEKLGLAKSDAEDLVNRLKEIRGTEVGVLITQMGNGLSRISFRSKNDVDVSAIAQSMGGGGHRRAAGVRTKLSPKEIKEKIEQSVAQEL